MSYSKQLEWLPPEDEDYKEEPFFSALFEYKDGCFPLSLEKLDGKWYFNASYYHDKESGKIVQDESQPYLVFEEEIEAYLNQIVSTIDKDLDRLPSINAFVQELFSLQEKHGVSLQQLGDEFVIVDGEAPIYKSASPLSGVGFSSYRQAKMYSFALNAVEGGEKG